MKKIGIVSEHGVLKTLPIVKQLSQMMAIPAATLQGSKVVELHNGLQSFLSSLESGKFEFLWVLLQEELFEVSAWRDLELDVLVFMSDEEEKMSKLFQEGMVDLLTHMGPKSYVITPIDLPSVFEGCSPLRFQTIAYGVHNLASVTASSILDQEITVCVQRAFSNISGVEIEPQEFSISFHESWHKEYLEVLAIVILGLVLDAPVEILQKLFLKSV